MQEKIEYSLTLEEVLNNKKYTVNYYQREYRWGRKQIEQLIDEIEEYIDGCKYQPLSNSKIIVNKEEIDELLRELRMKTPDEIKRYQKIISNKEAILSEVGYMPSETMFYPAMKVKEMIQMATFSAEAGRP